MGKIEDGGPAFPHDQMARDRDCAGMSLRDWFAGQVDVEGFYFGTDEYASEALGIPVPDIDDVIARMKFGAACQAYFRFMVADAMLAERERGK